MNKIVFVIGATKGGGAEKRAVLISKLLKDDFVTKVFAFHGETNPSIDHVYRSSYSFYKETSKKQRIVELRDFLKEEKPDFVFSFVPHINYFTSKAISCDELKKVKHIVGIVNIKTGFVDSILFKRSLKNAFAVYYQSEDQKQSIKFKGPSFVLANPIEIPERINRKPSLEMMSAGRLEPQKNYPLMIKAFAQIHKHFPEATLDIYGSGSQKVSIENLINIYGLIDAVKLYEFSDNLSSIYKEHSVFLFTTKYEGFPNALAEAMANGLVCFSTFFKSGCQDLLINDITGYVSKNNDAESFADLVTTKLVDTNKMSSISKAGYEHVKKVCDVESFKKNLTNILLGYKND